MLLLVAIDLSGADLAAFDHYEAQVLPMLAQHGGRLKLRVRAIDQRSETHLLYFPDESGCQAFLGDPARHALRPDWDACGANAVTVPVERYPRR